MVVTGSLFVQRFIDNWSDRDKVTEELAFLAREFVPRIQNCLAVDIRRDTIVMVEPSGESRTYTLSSGNLMCDNLILSREGLKVEALEIRSAVLPNEPNSDTLMKEELARGLYQLRIVVSDLRGNRDSLLTIVRNDHEYFKNSQN